MHKKVRKSRVNVFSSGLQGSRKSRGRVPRAAGAETCGQIRNEKLQAIAARSKFASKRIKELHLWNAPGS